ncbi:CG8298 [Drosophila busckii]|uniref:glycerol kinase n=1 Tax=Drosophila busckii TaxID=30019 RepID=A0A0M4EAR7_DROBS|nr:glycerol kinase [Drosophila busckii]ALC42221.1 CG8298 [Drosophila busckii]
MNNGRYGRFGALIGVAYVSSTHCRFLIYSTENAEVLAYHELKLRQIVHNAGWLEYDPAEIWKLMQECIETAYKNLVILEINPNDIIAVGIVNQRGTTVLWNKQTGQALHNAIGWSDCRSTSLLKTLLHNVRHNVNYVRYRSGLPLSSCFSALKIQWLLEHVPAVSKAVEQDQCLFGTLDSWLLWNLTGGAEGGVHSTDVTNAHYTSLMNLATQKWDTKLCKFFKLPMDILPRIRSNSEIYGYIMDGSLAGLPIAGVIGEQPSSLLGQLCIKAGQNVCTLDDSCFVLLNTAQQMIESTHGLITGIAHKLGPKTATHFTLEGAISNAGSTVNWLRKGLRIDTEINSNDNVVESLNTYIGENSMISSSCSSSMLNVECGLAAKRSEITFVPAFHGMYAPYWRYDARGILLGLSSQTTAENITQAAYEATGFQIYEVLEAFKHDTPNWDPASLQPVLTFGGEYAENSHLVQFIADIIGWMLERPQTTSPAGLGAMIAAGITMRVVSLQEATRLYAPPTDVFSPTTTKNRRELLYRRWDYAVKKCLQWNNYETYEADVELFAQRERDPTLHIRRSIPGSVFLTTSFALLLVASFLKNNPLT